MSFASSRANSALAFAERSCFRWSMGSPPMRLSCAGSAIVHAERFVYAPREIVRPRGALSDLGFRDEDLLAGRGLEAVRPAGEVSFGRHVLGVAKAGFRCEGD